LARELARRGHSVTLLTGYPRQRLDSELRPLAQTLPYLPTLELALVRAGLTRLSKRLSRLSVTTHDRWTARVLPPADALIALSQTAWATFLAAQRRGVRTILERGSAHIVTQRAILSAEYARQGLPAARTSVPAWAVRRELAEYALADRVVTLSAFARQTFLDQGVAAGKVVVNPLGVDLARFTPTGRMPRPNNAPLRVIYAGAVSLRKGIPDLLEGLCGQPGIDLVLVGGIDAEMRPIVRRYGGQFTHIPNVSQAALVDHYRAADVFAIASLEDGFGMVVPQAMACGLPVIGTANTGAVGMLIEDGREGFIVPIRDPLALRARAVYLRDHAEERRAMGAAGQAKVAGLGGWVAYGARAEAILAELIPPR